MLAKLAKWNLHRALNGFRDAVGKEWVFVSPDTLGAYLDPYAPRCEPGRLPLCSVAPDSAEQVQRVVRVANRFGLPLWPVSRGKNLGYGSAEPLLPSSVILDLRRMNRILEVDERHAYCVIEPGVSFSDLFNHLRHHRIALWMSIPGHSWGSVLGNALERGIGYTPYGEHASKLCGLEVVLPDGELIHTGMGAMNNSRCWHRYPAGLGPSWDPLFVQSNFGVITKAGLWLMPEPTATLRAQIHLPKIEDIAWAVDALAPLRLRGLIEHPIPVGNYVRTAAVSSRRGDWQTDSGPIAPEVERRIQQHFGLEYWNFPLRLFGYPEVIQAQAGIIQNALRRPDLPPLTFEPWRSGDPLNTSAAAIPSTIGLQIANWHGGEGAHVDFSPVLPSEGRLVLEYARAVTRRFAEFKLDYCASFTLGQRHLTNVNTIIFDRSNPSMVRNARDLYRILITDAAANGYGEYRAHVAFMDEVANSFAYNNHSMQRLNERVKDSLDPRGILAPGKNGIWPRKYRRQRF